MNDRSDNDSLSDDASMPPPRTPNRPNSRDSGDGLLSPSMPPTPADSVVPPTPGAPLRDDEPSTPLTPLSALDDPPEQEDDDERRNQDDGLAGEGIDAMELQNPAARNDEQLLDQGEEAHIRGTDVNVQTAAAAFVDFLRNFRSLRVASDQSQTGGDDSDILSSDDSSDEEAEELPPLYITKLQSLLTRGVVDDDQDGARRASLDIDAMHLYYHNEACQRFYHQLVAFPNEIVPLMDLIVQRELEALSEDVPGDHAGSVPRLQVRPFNLREVSNLRLSLIHI